MVAQPPGTTPLSAALAIFVKTRGVSPIKTRLARTLGGAAAEEFYRLSADAVAAIARATMAASIDLTVYWAVAERNALAHRDWRRFPTLWQGLGELGDRLEQVHAELRTRHQTVLMIGADSPQISSAHLATARAAVQDPATPFTIGRARDGGFWLVGSRAAIPRHAWQSVHYSETCTAAELSDALGALGTIAYLPELTDADTASDLPFLCAELSALTAPLPEQLVVRAWIEALPASFRPAIHTP